ncbi:MAG: Na(+)/H(+) antiporter subunit D, partial [Myxococcota bacterium]
LATLPDGAQTSLTVLGQEWLLLEMDPLSRVFSLAFALYAGVAGLYSFTEAGRGSRLASLALAGGGVGVCVAGDLLSMFFFWEWLSVGSVFLVWFGGRKASRAAGMRYVLFHVIGGMCLLAGILALAATGHSLAMTRLDFAEGGVATWLVLLGVATNAAIPPLHPWLPDAYPRATPSGTVFLSAFTTKAAVYALARLFPGTDLLVWAGAVMALYGVVFAVLENDIRRLLGYHIISQVGYMVCGVGLGSDLAIAGAAAHAFSHIFYKGLLMMSAGAVVHATGLNKLTELGGLGRKIPIVLVFAMIGGFSISGVPLFNGFVSKSMVVSAAAVPGRGAIEWMLVVASMGTFLHTGLKLPWFTFFGPQEPPKIRRPVPRTMIAAMALAAAMCIGTGLAPSLLYALLPGKFEYHPYTGDHVVQALQLLVGTALGFWILRGKLGGEATVTLDVDRTWRVALPPLLRVSTSALQGLGALVHNSGTRIVERVSSLGHGLRHAGAWHDLAGRVGLIAVAAALLALLLTHS